MRSFLRLVLLVGGAGLHLSAQVFLDEHATRTTMVKDRTTVSLAVENKLKRPVDATLRVEWLRPNDTVAGSAQQAARLAPEHSEFSIALPLPAGPIDARLLRLRYTIIPATRNYTAFEIVSGILSLVHIDPYSFSLKVAGTMGARPGRPLELRVLASHPATHEPIAQVHVEAEGAASTTDKTGWAVLKVPLPKDYDGEDLTVSGRLGDFTQTAELSSLVLARGQIRIEVDKPLYQPGQTMHVRTLALDSGGLAYAAEKQEIRVLDEQGNPAHVASVTSSKYGIGWTDWAIPSNAKAGKYSIQVNPDNVEGPFTREVEIRPYELPSFRVSAQSTRAYYLPGEAATAELKAEYLFGKPVPHANARVEQGDGQKTVWRGQLDAAGMAQALLPLDERALAPNDNFSDKHYVAFVTDPTTNRTEQRQFDVRLSRTKLHMYVVRREAGTSGARLYVSTYFPDGRPAPAAMVRASGGGECTTNRFGVCAIDLPAGADAFKLYATMPTGDRSETLDEQADEEAALVLETEHALYRKGSTVRCRISTRDKGGSVLLLAWNVRQEIVFSRLVTTANGEATVEIPYQPRFGQRLALAATGGDANAFDSKEVLFPGAAAFQVTATPAKHTYRPGESARIDFHASSQAALGIAIVDESVLERAETDAMGQRPEWWSWHDGSATVGGISQAELLQLDPAKIDSDFELLARALMSQPPALVETDNWLELTQTAFSGRDSRRLTPLERQLDAQYQQAFDYPRDEHGLYSLRFGLNSLRDSWGRPYFPVFSTHGSEDVLCIQSAGPDRQKGTKDDYCALRIARPWFGLYQALIKKALAAKPDFPASEDEFNRELASSGILFPALRDHWGNQLHVAVSYSGPQRDIGIKSAGPDGKWDTPDDVSVANFSGSYFSDTGEAIRRALEAATPFPLNTDDAMRALRAGGVHFDTLRDPWGHALSLSVHLEEQFTDSISFYNYAEYGGSLEPRQKATPVKIRFAVAEIKSDGPDGVHGTSDDFTLLNFAHLLTESPTPTTSASPAVGKGATGAASIAGVVQDQREAGVAGASVYLDGVPQSETDANGVYMLAGVPAGVYELNIRRMGFQSYVLAHVPAIAGQVTQADAVLQVGSVSQTVQLSATASSRPDSKIATPRVREYFPETLYWQPELITDGKGNASVNVKLADSVTTWKVKLVASTLDGAVSEGAADIRAFQPFLVDLDVPPVLTQGDRITVPVPVRNYLERAQTVHVTATTTAGLTASAAVDQPGRIAASTSGDALLHLRAAASDAAAKVKVTAVSERASDAVEKAVLIHPDGQLFERSTTDLIAGTGDLTATLPTQAIAGSVHAEVRLYPNVVSRIVEAMAVLLEQPAGCGEQVVSTAYPNLLFLRALKQAGIKSPKLEAKALRNLQLGYERLLRYQADSGAFTYWGRDDVDLALTAYVLRFLRGAQEFITVDGDRVQRAQNWLADRKPADERSKIWQLEGLGGSKVLSTFDMDERLAELARTASRFNDPYAVAQFASAAMEAGNAEVARDSIHALVAAAQPDEGATFWSLVANTPFHGWGHSGQVETTAVVVRALALWHKQQPNDAASAEALRRGTLYLLRNAAARGGWYTGQATVQALLALLETWHKTGAAGAAHFTIRVDGSVAGEMETNRNNSEEPLKLDVSRFVHPGRENRVTVTTSSSGQTIEAQFAASWYESWTDDRQAADLRLESRFDHAEAAVNDAITCRVTVSRPNFRGYGMLLARIGLPPGSEVDRGTLAAAMADPKSSVDSYEVAPDSVTFYVWPRAADSVFSFVFRPRFAADAKSAESALYDYYNPDDRAVLTPQLFRVLKENVR